MGREEKEYRGSLDFLLLLGHFNLQKHEISKASSRPRSWPPQPGSRGAKPDVRPLVQQPVATDYVGCHSLSFPLIASLRLVAGSAPMQLRFHWLPPKLDTFTSLPFVRSRVSHLPPAPVARPLA